MENLLVVLSFVSLIALVIGIIKPRLVGMPSSTWVLLVFGGIAVVSFTILGANASPTPTASNQAIAAPVTPQDAIEKIADDAALGTTNTSNEPHLRSADVVKDPQGGWGVNVQLNGDSNLTEHLTEVGVDEQISDEFIALYTSTTTVSSVTVTVLLPLTDKYGNTSDQEVYIASLDKATASKVNWGLDKSSLEVQILPGVWETDYDLFATDPNL